jgi:hypothetical protein
MGGEVGWDMTHEIEPNQDEWEHLGDAAAFEPVLLDVPVGDLGPGEIDPVAEGSPVPEQVD